MTRRVIVLLLGLAAGSARAQTPTCTYDSCALRLRNQFFAGVSLVQGQEGRRVARLDLFASRVDALASGSDSTKAHYLAYRKLQNRGARLIIGGLVAAGVMGAVAGALDRGQPQPQPQPQRAHSAALWGFAVATVGLMVWGGANQEKATDHLQQSIWFYNRDLPR